MRSPPRPVSVLPRRRPADRQQLRTTLPARRRRRRPWARLPARRLPRRTGTRRRRPCPTRSPRDTAIADLPAWLAAVLTADDPADDDTERPTKPRSSTTEQ